MINKEFENLIRVFATNAPSILAEAASDESDNRASFSSYGVTTVEAKAFVRGVRSRSQPGNRWSGFRADKRELCERVGSAR